MDTLDNLTQSQESNPLFDALVRFGDRYGENYTLVEKITEGDQDFVQQVIDGKISELDSPEAKHLAMIVLDQKFINK